MFCLFVGVSFEVKCIAFCRDRTLSPPSLYIVLQNSVRHNLSLHSRFVKIQNDTSGKSSWWTVNLDAKSSRTSRRRSHSVDNTNAPSPKTKKKEKRSKMKKGKGVSSSNDVLSSPCASPTASQPLLQPPWSPNPSCPSPTGSDLSPCYSPVLQSPVLQRSSRNVTPVSPLISPLGIDQQNGSLLSGSNSSLLDGDGHFTPEGDPGACVDMFSQLNLRSSREGMGSSSSLSSLNSPRPQPLRTKSPHPVFTFNNAPMDSSGYSSSYFSDTDISEPVPPPPAYEEHVVHAIPQPSQPPHRPTCYTPTRAHPLHISLAADPNRPRSGSEPAPVNLSSRFPQDLDMELFNHSDGFPNCDVETIIQNEMAYGNGELDFQFGQQRHHQLPGHHQHHYHHHHLHQQQVTMGPSDPTLTSVALQEPITTFHHHGVKPHLW